MNDIIFSEVKKTVRKPKAVKAVKEVTKDDRKAKLDSKKSVVKKTKAVKTVKKVTKSDQKPNKKLVGKTVKAVKAVIKDDKKAKIDKKKSKVPSMWRKEPLNKKLAKIVESFGGPTEFSQMLKTSKGTPFSQSALSRVLHGSDGNLPKMISHQMAMEIDRVTEGKYSYKAMRGIKKPAALIS